MVPYSYQLTAMGKFALLRYLSEFRLSFVVLIIGNSKSNHLDSQGTFNTPLSFRSQVRRTARSDEANVPRRRDPV